MFAFAPCLLARHTIRMTFNPGITPTYYRLSVCQRSLTLSEQHAANYYLPVIASNRSKGYLRVATEPDAV